MRTHSRSSVLRFMTFAAGVALALAIAPAPASAAPQWLAIEIAQPQSGGAAYWTPERMRNAKPLPLPSAGDFQAASVDDSSAGADLAGESVSAEGGAPTLKVRASMRQMIEQDPEVAAAVQALQDADKAVPENYGSLNAQFSSTRVFPDAATTTYPYLTVGKLFFTQPGVGNFICSASVIKRRLIITAGHCVHKGSGNTGGFYTNFAFVPAYNNGARPFGTWNAAYVIVTGTWAGGNGVVPNAADYAIIEPADLSCNGSPCRVGDVTGYLGYQTLKLFPNHAHLLGYPANLDSAQRMHQITAQSLRKTNPNCAEYGSDMTGGSSGGPWVQNFGVASVGQTAGSNTGANRVIGVTSYGYTPNSPLVQGASILDSRFTNGSTGILNTACAHRSGNCT